MNDFITRAMAEIGAKMEGDTFPLPCPWRPLDTVDFEEFAKSPTVVHDEYMNGDWKVELFAGKFFNAPMQVAMRVTSTKGNVKHYEIGCKHDWKTQSSSIPRRGIYDYRCSKCGATYTYDSSD